MTPVDRELRGEVLVTLPRPFRPDANQKTKGL